MKALTNEELETIKAEARREGYVACLIDYRPRASGPANLPQRMREREMKEYREAAARKYPLAVDTKNLMREDSSSV